MQKTITIIGSGSGVYDIATYTQFQQEMYRILSEFGGDQYQTFRFTPEFTNNWVEKIRVLVDVNKVIRATIDTQKLAEIDTLRDKAISRFFNGIKYGLDSFEPAEVEAARRLDLIRKKYNGIQKLNYDRQTASVDGLLHDLQDSPTQGDIMTLGLLPIYQKIRETNEDFRRLYGSISDTRATTKLPTFVELRNEMSPIWEEAVQCIQAGYIFAPNDVERKRIFDLSEAINQRIKQIKDAFSRSQGARKATAKKVRVEKTDANKIE